MQSQAILRDTTLSFGARGQWQNLEALLLQIAKTDRQLASNVYTCA